MKVEIRKGIPLPPKPRRSNAQWDFMKAMSVGDSFIFPTNSAEKSARAAIYYQAARLGIKVAVRPENGVYAVWRIA